MSKITFTIPDEKLDDFLEAFIKAEPILPNLVNKTGPQMTSRQWYRKWVKLKSIDAYRKGKRKMATVDDEGIFL
jgi:hypothetical protein